ncbi:AAA family ATPase [Thermodesulfobacteriota bacterium]
MYLSHYQLDRKPFQISTDPNFLWLGDKHKEALAVLRYGLMDNKGFLLLTGDVGTGKTTLINALVNTLGEEIIVATLLDPGIDRDDFFSYIGKAFQLKQAFSSKGAFVHSFSDFLNRAYDERKKVLLIIDESQRLSQELLEEIRLLSNIEKQSTKLINIFFVGQIEFNSIILEPKNSALRQRISVNYDLKPLSAKETGKYIHHRLKVAGAAKSLFNAAAVREVFRFSNGYPRLTNIICDRALVTGFISESKKIGPKIIKECARELKLQSQKSRLKRKKSQDKTAPATDQLKSASLSRNPLIEKVLYTILALLITTWVAIAVYYYYPQYFPFQRTPAAQVANPTALSVEDGRMESGEQTIIPKKINSTQTTQKQLSETAASENHPGVQPDPRDNPTQFQMPDPHMVIRIEFDGNNEFSTDGIETLDNLSAVLHNHPRLEISIKGYSESPGSYRYNKKMSEFTANIVKNYLVGKGVSSQRIETMGMWVIHSDSNVPTTETLKNAQWVEIQFTNP